MLGALKKACWLGLSQATPTTEACNVSFSTWRSRFFDRYWVVGGALTVAALAGLLLFWALQAAFPRPVDEGYPGYLILLFAALVLLPILVVLARRVPYLTDWYYLLPAITFLLAFTVFPIILTIYYAFTDYTGIRNGKPDRSTETAIVRVEGRQLFVEGNAHDLLRCDQPDCAGQALEITTRTQRARVRIEQANDEVITLTAPPPFTPILVYKINEFRFIGFRNFVEIFSRAGTVLIPVLVWNIIFAAGAVVVGAIPGLILGLMLNNKNLALRGFYRTALIIS